MSTKLYQKAAQHGSAAAQANLAFAFLAGLGVEKSETKAAHWFQKAAEKNLPIAQYALSELYEGGKGVKQDPVIALKWLRLAELGNYAPASAKAATIAKTLTPEQLREADKLVASFKPN
jgi:hypothetical protein